MNGHTPGKMRVECNDIKCGGVWDLNNPDQYMISGNRIVGGPMITCPKCGRRDRPYISAGKEG